MNKLEHLPREKPKMLGDLNKGELFVFCNPPKELPVTWTSILEVVEVEGVDESRKKNMRRSKKRWSILNS